MNYTVFGILGGDVDVIFLWVKKMFDKYFKQLILKREQKFPKRQIQKEHWNMTPFPSKTKPK